MQEGKQWILEELAEANYMLASTSATASPAGTLRGIAWFPLPPKSQVLMPALTDMASLLLIPPFPAQSSILLLKVSLPLQLAASLTWSDMHCRERWLYD